MSTATTHEKSAFGFESKEGRFSNLSENEDIQETEKSVCTESIPAILEVFNIEKKLGSGSFSTVYLGSLKKDPTQKYALKHIVATNHPSRTINELNFLMQFGGKESIIGMTTCIRHDDMVVLVMPLFIHHKFQTYVCDMSVTELHTYMKHLLTCLSIIHAEGVIHRDVKPSNFLYNRDLNKFALIDFGLSQRQPQNNKSSTEGWRRKSSSTLSTPSNTPLNISKPLSTNHNTNLLPVTSVHPSNHLCQCSKKPKVCRSCLSKPSQSASRAGTPGFRAPEVLIKCPNQTTAIDIWSAGIIMLSLVSGIYPIMKSTDDLTSLCQMTQLLGSRAMMAAAHVLGKKMLCAPNQSGIDLRRFCLDLTLHKIEADNNINNKTSNNINTNNNNTDTNKTNNNNKNINNNKDDRPKEVKMKDDRMKDEEMKDEAADKNRKRSNEVVFTPEKNVKSNKPRFDSPIKLLLHDPSTSITTPPNKSTTTPPTKSTTSPPTKSTTSPPTTPSSIKPLDLFLSSILPDSAYDLLKGLLDPNPFTRLTASQALACPFLISPPS